MAKRHPRPKLTVEQEYIRSLMQDPYSDVRVRVSDSEEYRLRIVSRGEQAFYQQNERAMLIDISPIHSAISKKSIHRWDDGASVTVGERDVILRRMADYLTRPGSPPVVVTED